MASTHDQHQLAGAVPDAPDQQVTRADPHRYPDDQFHRAPQPLPRAEPMDTTAATGAKNGGPVPAPMRLASHQARPAAIAAWPITGAAARQSHQPRPQVRAGARGDLIEQGLAPPTDLRGVPGYPGSGPVTSRRSTTCPPSVSLCAAMIPCRGTGEEIGMQQVFEFAFDARFRAPLALVGVLPQTPG